MARLTLNRTVENGPCFRDSQEMLRRGFNNNAVADQIERMVFASALPTLFVRIKLCVNQ
jgi:hypothetical protein